MKRLFTFALFFLPLLLTAQSAYQYSLSWERPADHIYQVSLTTSPAEGPHSDFQLPAWRPGRYYFQDYAAAVSGFAAKDAQGNDLAFRKVSSTTWRVERPSSGDITISYDYYANVMDAGSSVLNEEQAYFNPVNLFMHLANEYERPCTLRVPSMGANWKAGTALKKSGQGTFTAGSYHDFVDSPTVLSPSLKTLHSRIDGADFYFHFQGKFPDDKATEDAFQSNLGKIIREQQALFQDMPLEEYHFIYQLLPYNMGHAVEHKFSAMFALPDRMATSPEAIARANGISAHEFFHLWNVKRIRPAALWPYDYQQEQYTGLHWFTEGVTEYYTQLTLVRAGLMDRDRFYRIFAATIGSIANNPASRAVSPAQSSMDSWLSRSDYGPSYHRISYYTQGMLVGLALDIRLRSLTKGKKSLDDLFRLLYAQYYKQGKGVGEDDVQKELQAISKKDFDDFFKRYVSGVEMIPYKDLLSEVGLDLGSEVRSDATWQHVGIRQFERTDAGEVKVKQVVPGSDASLAGISEGMLIEQVNGKPAADFDAEAFFYSHKPDKRLAVQTRSRTRVAQHEILWTAQAAPMEYVIREDRRMSKKTRKLLDAWLGSNVGE